jgi:hypothetical protein
MINYLDDAVHFVKRLLEHVLVGAVRRFGAILLSANLAGLEVGLYGVSQLLRKERTTRR